MCVCVCVCVCRHTHVYTCTHAYMHVLTNTQLLYESPAMFYRRAQLPSAGQFLASTTQIWGKRIQVHVSWILLSYDQYSVRKTLSGQTYRTETISLLFPGGNPKRRHVLVQSTQTSRPTPRPPGATALGILLLLLLFICFLLFPSDSATSKLPAVALF